MDPILGRGDGAATWVATTGSAVFGGSGAGSAVFTGSGGGGVFCAVVALAEADAAAASSSLSGGGGMSAVVAGGGGIVGCATDPVVAVVVPALFPSSDKSPNFTNAPMPARTATPITPKRMPLPPDRFGRTYSSSVGVELRERIDRGDRDRRRIP